jgi:hypothetical protein
MKVTIDLENLKRFIISLESEEDEWYGPVNHMTGSCILSFFRFNGNKKMEKEFESFLTLVKVEERNGN